MPVVRVSWFEGKDHSQKEKVAAEITESIVRNTQTDPNRGGAAKPNTSISGNSARTTRA